MSREEQMKDAKKSWGTLYPGGTAQVVVVWLPQHVGVKAKMQLQRDLQELAGGDPSQRVDTKLLELLWSYMPGLGHLNRWAYGLRRAGGQEKCRVESSDVRERGGRHCWQVTAGSKRSQCSLTDKCHIHEGATRALGTSTKGSGDGETEAPPACGGRIESHQARPSSRAELLFFTQVLCP
ncbi:PREDICTED: uncharacterized protein LOC108448942 isoform X3 [Corvus brachyrhynchos]|uniref:uncharacterized protein LOC108448942 isoform X3 n=1 Tax=Corvus brachyrhynchos TaxID=85066 RepID=UPI0008163F94|nr:PREDICTED: uncharacterized protein LOC108448942 isoform X3 [Corvus brachyrhynchos]